MQLIATLLVCYSAAATAQQPASAHKKHPYASCKVGDWVSHRCTTNNETPISVKQSVESKNEKQVTLKMETKLGKSGSEREMIVDLTADPFNPQSIMGVKPEVKKLGEGTEKITIGEKIYNCSWLQIQVTIQVGEIKVSNIFKTWLCKDIPCGGMVKTEFEGSGLKCTCELVDYGVSQ